MPTCFAAFRNRKVEMYHPESYQVREPNMLGTNDSIEAEFENSTSWSKDSWNY